MLDPDVMTFLRWSDLDGDTLVVGARGHPPRRRLEASWKIPVRMTSQRTIVKIYAAGPAGASPLPKVTIQQK